MKIKSVVKEPIRFSTISEGVVFRYDNNGLWNEMILLKIPPNTAEGGEEANSVDLVNGTLFFIEDTDIITPYYDAELILDSNDDSEESNEKVSDICYDEIFDVIHELSDIRAQYNLFDREGKRKYHACSLAIRALRSMAGVGDETDTQPTRKCSV